MPFDYQMVTYEEIIKNHFFKWAQLVKTTAFVDLKTLKFRKWFKYRLKAQKFQKQHALKGQKLLAQGSALGIMAVSNAPCKGNSLINCPVFKSFCPCRATNLRP